MKAAIALIGAGAGLMYLFDPAWGARRRGRARDRMVSALNTSGDVLATTARDVAHRSTGLAAEARARLSESTPPDDVLVERVRSQIGRVVSHPRAIDVMADNGRITLRGPILAQEADRLCSTVANVRGVNAVRDELTKYRTGEGVPALQGGAPRPGMKTLRENWSPTTRFFMGGAGAALAAYGFAKRDKAGAAMTIAGATILARAAANLEMRRLTGIGAKRRAVELQKTISIDAAIDRVYAFWEQYENFPRFMTYVRDVRPTRSPRQSHWVVQLPGAIPFEFDAEITRRIPNQLLAWRTVGRTAVQHAGIVRFDQNPDGSTRVHIRFSYNPPAGALGHGFVALLGADARSLMDEDLVRMKTLIETGRPPHDAAQPSGSKK